MLEKIHKYEIHFDGEFSYSYVVFISEIYFGPHKSDLQFIMDIAVPEHRMEVDDS